MAEKYIIIWTFLFYFWSTKTHVWFNVSIHFYVSRVYNKEFNFISHPSEIIFKFTFTNKINFFYCDFCPKIKEKSQYFICLNLRRRTFFFQNRLTSDQINKILQFLTNTKTTTAYKGVLDFVNFIYTPLLLLRKPKVHFCFSKTTSYALDYRV